MFATILVALLPPLIELVKSMAEQESEDTQWAKWVDFQRAVTDELAKAKWPVTSGPAP